MLFDTSGFDEDGSNNKYEPQKDLGFTEAFSTSFKQTMAVENTTSSLENLKGQIHTQRRELIAKSPKDTDFINRYYMTYNDPVKLTGRRLLEDGSVYFDKGTGTFKGTNGIGRAYSKRQDLFSNITKMQQIEQTNGALDRPALVEKADSEAKATFLETKKALDSTTTMGTVGEFAGSMWGAMHDPLLLSTMFAGGPVTTTATRGALKTAGAAMLQEAKIATATEFPTQALVYDYKNQIGVDYKVADAVLNGVASITVGTALRGAGSYAIDVTPDLIKKYKAKATPNEKATIQAYETVVNNKSIADDVDHINALAETRQQIDDGVPVNVVEIVGESDKTAIGKAVDETEGNPSLMDEAVTTYKEQPDYIPVKTHEAIITEAPPTAHILESVDPETLATHPRYNELLDMMQDVASTETIHKGKLADKGGQFAIRTEDGLEHGFTRDTFTDNPLHGFELSKEVVGRIRKGTATADDIAKLQSDLTTLDLDPRWQVVDDIDYNTLDDLGITNSGKNEYEMEENIDLNKWYSEQKEDIMITKERVVDEDGEVVDVMQSLLDLVEESNNDIDTIKRLEIEECPF